MSSLFARYQEPIEKAIQTAMVNFGPKTKLRDAVEYSLKQGKRFRPAIAYMVANAQGANLDNVTPAALAIEYFHTASLIADDLPCMDDDDERREAPSLHKIYGEATAILATYALISAGYDSIRLGAQKMGNRDIGFLAIENVSLNTGILGATGGQYEDLYPSEISEQSILDIIDKKTGALFEISFVSGWLFGGGDCSLLGEIKRAARSFGRAFQISDDFLDLQQDKDGLNFPAVAGKQKGFSVLASELQNYYQSLKRLGLEVGELQQLGQIVENRINTHCASVIPIPENNVINSGRIIR